MGKSRKRSRSSSRKRSRSISRDRSKSPKISKRDLQQQITSMAKSIAELIEAQKAANKALNPQIQSKEDIVDSPNRTIPENSVASAGESGEKGPEVEKPDAEIEDGEVTIENDDYQELDNELLEVLGEEVTDSDCQRVCSGKRERPTCEIQAGGLVLLEEIHGRELPSEGLDDIIEGSAENQHRQEPDVEKEIDTRSKEVFRKVNRIAGRLKYFVEQWREVTDDRFILHCIEGCNIQFENAPVQLCESMEPTWSPEEHARIKAAIQGLSSKQAVEICTAIEDHPFTPITLSSLTAARGHLTSKPGGNHALLPC
ncbi:hypothetical protein KPH14_011885 [Odynerus spinipes]|uniref:Uncharacterized protein n=1 Tax=Odynerus spinipes TaxID=1348599 RepID=A0AAD9R9K2_9HYME|nr:hypothetical protein KPH14_011885 [Odynerus spinipes]